MKKNIALVLALVMLLALTACGARTAKTKQPAPAKSAASEAVKTEMSFGNTQPNTDVESLQLYACEKAIEDATDGNFLKKSIIVQTLNPLKCSLSCWF
ncbi:hypothetical protein [Treponema parvum]|uniref:hypothetical protein n=1 Tax=Treponema parvum TaxID=138851 RepID=UPI001AEC02D9|nr:hypothetical protein [Treponema parvum]QTQ15907.1 hypothetical protein HXT04_03880 [Treponema parvum]